MPDETNEQEDGQVSKAAEANEISSAEAASLSEEEPVGSNRKENRPVRKMSAADFRKPQPKAEPAPEPKKEPVPEPKKEPKPEPTPEPKPEPVHKAAAPKHEHQAPAQPKPEPKPEAKAAPIPSSVPSSVPEPKKEPVQEPVYKEPVKEPEPEPKYEEPVYEYEEPQEPVAADEPEYEEEPQEPRSSGGGPIEALKAAFSFFTIIRLNVNEREIQAMNQHFFIVPFIGLFIGLIAAIIGIVFFELRTGLMAAVAVLATSYILSKFLHLDGLADFGDGILATGSQDKCIKALKDTRIGAGGLGMALIVVLAIYAGYTGMNIALLLVMTVITLEIFAKNAMVAAAAFGDPGTGMAAEQVRSSNFTTLMISTGMSAGLALAGFIIMAVIGNFVFHIDLMGASFLDTKHFISGILVIAAAAASSIFVGWLIAYLSNRQFGFVNGDCLGAANEISKVLVLIIAPIIFGFYLLA